MKIAIWGLGGAAKDAFEVYRAKRSWPEQNELVGFLSDWAPAMFSLGDFPFLGGIEWVRQHPDVSLIVAIGNPATRKEVVRRLEIEGAKFGMLVHPTALISHGAMISPGSVFCAYATIGVDAKIGAHAWIAQHCAVGHDTQIADFVSMYPHAVVGGGSTIGEGATFCSGAHVKDHTAVGAWSVVGMQAAVIRNVMPGAMALGVPAKER